MESVSLQVRGSKALGDPIRLILRLDLNIQGMVCSFMPQVVGDLV